MNRRFFCKNRNYGIFSIVTTSGESAPGQQWRIDIGTCTVRTRAAASDVFNRQLFIITIWMLKVSHGSEVCINKYFFVKNIWMLMGSQGSEGYIMLILKEIAICMLMELQSFEGST